MKKSKKAVVVVDQPKVQVVVDKPTQAQVAYKQFNERRLQSSGNSTSFKKTIRQNVMAFTPAMLLDKDALKKQYEQYKELYPDFESFSQTPILDLLAFSIAKHMFSGSTPSEKTFRTYEAIRCLDNMGYDDVKVAQQSVVVLTNAEKNV